jgi:hypothetical protein
MENRPTANGTNRTDIIPKTASLMQFLTEHHAMKTYGENGGIVHIFLTSAVSFIPRPLYPSGKETQVPIG